MEYVTLAHVLMSRRQKKDYSTIFGHIRTLMSKPLRLKNVVADFESGELLSYAYRTIMTLIFIFISIPYIKQYLFD